MPWKRIVASLATLLLGACTAPLVDAGVAKFHTGAVQANAMLINDANDVVSIARFGSIADTLPLNVGPKDVTMASTPTPGDFANYVCMQSTQFAFLRAQQGSLAALDVGQRKEKPELDSESEKQKKVIASFEKCTSIVLAYVTTPYGGLPNVGILPAPKKAGLTAEGAVAGITLIGAVGKLLKATYDGVKAEVRASQIKAVVTRPDTQRQVLTAFANLSKADEELKVYCDESAKRNLICKSVLPEADEGDKHRHFEIVSDDFNNVCAATRRPNTAKASRTEYTVMDKATIFKRWMALRIAYYRFSDMNRYSLYAQSLAPGRTRLKAFESRRAALDLAVAQYAAIKPAADVVADQRQAWANLTASACGMLTTEQMFEAMSAFADRMKGISDEYKNVSEAHQKYKSIVFPEPPAEETDD